jgi:hypothetical protein
MEPRIDTDWFAGQTGWDEITPDGLVRIIHTCAAMLRRTFAASIQPFVPIREIRGLVTPP